MDLSESQKDEIVVVKLKANISNFKRAQKENIEYHSNDINQSRAGFVPIFSWNYQEERDQLKKQIKACKRVLEWYTV